MALMIGMLIAFFNLSAAEKSLERAGNKCKKVEDKKVDMIDYLSHLKSG